MSRHGAGTTVPGDLPAHRYAARLANEIELRWQRRWEEEGTFQTPNPVGALSDGFGEVADRPTLYVLDMFPYPSGAGLHVGHPLGYIGTDVFARYMRMRGYQVLHPFGYDSFGLPAEQYAIETGAHPRTTTERNVANMRRQLRRLGLGHDPRREIATSEVRFYRWTQWIFLQIFNAWFDVEQQRARPITDLVHELDDGVRQLADGRGRQWSQLSELERRRVIDGHRLAYIDRAPVNWCPGLGTVLANEEVTADGRSEVGNFPVYRRSLRQWKIRITAYAERLLDDLDLVDWPESIRAMQRNWIGRSEGAHVQFGVCGMDEEIDVFTTRPDTVFGATFLVMAPEHPLVERLVAAAWPDDAPLLWRGTAGTTPAEAVAAYRDATARRSERDRLVETAPATGVFTGSFASNPATGERIPVFVAEYVLADYGTGAIMAVPAHDQRDFEFARPMRLPMRAVVQPPPGWFAEHRIAADAPVDVWPEAFGGEGVATGSSAEITLVGLPTDVAKRETVDWLEARGVGRGTVGYRLRDWLFSRQRYWGEPFPIVYDEAGLPVALPESHLPVELPDMTDFAPRPRPDDDPGDPEPPLARVRDWVDATLDLGDGPRRYRREVNTMPQWAGSCWYYLRYLDPTNDRAFVDAGNERYWMLGASAGATGARHAPGSPAAGGVDLYVGGVEHAVLHLLYARLWHKILFDLGHVATPEPFNRLFNQGYILAAAFTDHRGAYAPADEVTSQDGRYSWRGRPVTREYGKMGKSLKNGVSPDAIYDEYGADTLRLYEMAMAPLDTDRAWDTTQISGVFRFLQRLWRNVVDEDSGEANVGSAAASDETRRLLHRTIAKVNADFERMHFNTAIAALIELNNHLTIKRQQDGPLPREVIEPLILVVAPLAPHLAEELWSRLGHDGSLAYVAFPEADPEVLAAEDVVIPVQVNGKVRFQLSVAAHADENAIRTAALGDSRLEAYTRGQAVVRVVVVPGRIVNVVLRPAA